MRCIASTLLLSAILCGPGHAQEFYYPYGYAYSSPSVYASGSPCTYTYASPYSYAYASPYAYAPYGYTTTYNQPDYAGYAMSSPGYVTSSPGYAAAYPSPTDSYPNYVASYSSDSMDACPYSNGPSPGMTPTYGQSGSAAGGSYSAQRQGGSYGSPSQEGPTTISVGLYDNRFEPSALNIIPGTTVRWTNRGQHKHTVTSEDGSRDSGDLAPGATYSATFDQPGTYSYVCRYHSEMRATIQVGQAPAAGYRDANPTASVPRSTGKIYRTTAKSRVMSY